MNTRIKSYTLIALLLIVLAGCNNSNDHKTQDDASASLVTLNASMGKARELRHDKKYAEAIALYKQIVATEQSDDIEGDSLLAIVSNAMMHTMNSYQSLGKSDECVGFFDSLRASHTKFIDEYAKRDLFIISAYATSRTDDMKKAELLADSALKMPLRDTVPERLFRDYAYAAAVFFPNPSRQTQVISLSEKALEVAKMSHNTNGEQYVTTMLGMIYRRMGQLPAAINLYLESLKQAEAEGDTTGQATACNTLADLYLYWRLPKYADIYATKAVALGEKMTDVNAMTYTQSLLLKGGAAAALGKCDTALTCFNKAENTCRNLPYTNGMADVDYHLGKYLIYNYSGDSLKLGIDRLKRVVASGTSLLRAKTFYAMAEGYHKANDDANAEVCLDSMYTILHDFSPTQYIDINYKAIIDHYAKKGDMLHVKQYAIDLAAAYEAEANYDIRTRMYETIVELKTDATRQEFEIKEMKLASERHYWQMWLVLLGAIIIVMTSYMVYRRKINNAKRLLMEKELSSLLDRLEDAKREKKDVEQQLADIINKGEEEHVEKSIEIPLLLENEGIHDFRQRFERIYPDFVADLRKRVPGISRTEEIHCMLIVLGQDMHHVATLMGIAYRSVNMARYRLRKKFNLGEDETLESAIKQLVGQ